MTTNRPKRTVVDFVRENPGATGLELREKGWNPIKHGFLQTAQGDGLIESIVRDGRLHWFPVRGA